MFIIVVMVFALVGLLASLIYLADFARASRRDALFLPASTRRARRARRVTGMYTRGSEFLSVDGGGDRRASGTGSDDIGDGGDLRGDELVGR
ncbi:hypothetical protein [Actinomadura roseirufa]|uniref:hypothetical protein n=1 Tax=Actinomadura roseirufa TaxID=2094049 RepID=UPI0010410B6C|nr:hypothetical protein [Actinomadura roseirufa]